MKRKLLLGMLLASSFCFSQTTIFEENWDGAGPGIGSWTLYNLDGLTPVGPTGTDGEPLSFLVQNAWNVLTLANITAANPAYTTHPAGATGMANNIVASNSWYNPAGTANDWLVSPLITVPAGATGVNLTWAASSLGNATFLEDYEVYISPSGGNAVANFTTLLLDVNNELSAGNFRTVSLNAYVGTSFRIAFRNNGVDQYVMFLDNIKVAAATLSADSFTLSGVKVYPNPAKDVLNIQSDIEVLTKVSITDLNGRVVKEVTNNLSQISLGNLAKGIYMVTIESATAKKVEKLIIE